MFKYRTALRTFLPFIKNGNERCRRTQSGVFSSFKYEYYIVSIFCRCIYRYLDTYLYVYNWFCLWATVTIHLYFPFSLRRVGTINGHWKDAEIHGLLSKTFVPELFLWTSTLHLIEGNKKQKAKKKANKCYKIRAWELIFSNVFL